MGVYLVVLIKVINNFCVMNIVFIGFYGLGKSSIIKFFLKGYK